MKPLPFRIPHADEQSIKIEHDRLQHFYSTLHTHTETQLTMIIEGSGIAYIGDKVDRFKEGDIYLLGSELPHVFRDEDQTRSGFIESLSIFFRHDFMGQDFLALPESRNVKELFQQAERGIKLEETLAREIKNRIIDVVALSGVNRLATLATILENIATSATIECLASLGYRRPRRPSDNQKINAVFEFLLNNYSSHINLQDVAAIANMSPTAFCRYFKQHTRKTYSRFLNEIRVGQACKLLMSQTMPVSTICYHCGFNNISNFNRQFKSITGFTPSKYIKQLVREPASLVS